MPGIDLRAFESPDEVREFERGRFEVVRIGGMVVGRATYEPGWRWSQHVGGDPDARCQVEHVGLVISGRAAVLMDDGEERVMEPGELFHVAARPRLMGRRRRALRVAALPGAGDYAA